MIEFKIRSFIYGSVRVCVEECAHEAMQKCKDSNVEKLNEKEIEKWMKIYILWCGWLFFFSRSRHSRVNPKHILIMLAYKY